MLAGGFQIGTRQCNHLNETETSDRFNMRRADEACPDNTCSKFLHLSTLVIYLFF
ncbi:hypothetical protein D3C87_1153470 [compost metagenome]